MRKLKYQGGITKYITTRIAKTNKQRFAKEVEKNLGALVTQIQAADVNIDVMSYSSHKDFYDQVLSILSFLRYVGKPSSWTLCSDGSHKQGQFELLKRSFPFIKIWKEDWNLPDEAFSGAKLASQSYFKDLLHYTKNNAYAKKVYYYLNHSVVNPTLCIDADILFYRQAHRLHLAIEENNAGWFLPDANWTCLDSRYMARHQEEVYQVNSGFFLLNREIEKYDNAIAFLANMKENYEHFSEQTMFHILFRENGFMPFDPRHYILNSKDQFDFGYLYGRESMAIRHYTGPVRHKMWQRDWKWHLNLR